MKTTRKRTSRPPAQTGVGRWELVPVDGTPLRKKAQREYQKAVRDLDAATLESERFHNEDRPLYGKWMASNFGALLTEIRDLQGRLFEAQNLVNEVQQEFYFGGHDSITSAYREVLHRRAHPEEVKAEEDEEEDEEDEEMFKEVFEEIFGKSAEAFWEQAQAKRQEARIEKSEKGGSRLKELYRKLARRLHPDKGHTLSNKEKEWWHQTQTAYRDGNVEQLEVILTLVEVDGQGTKEASISTLQQITASFKKTLRTLKRQLKELRQDMAWDFSQRTDRSALLRQTRVALETDRDQILALLLRCEGQIQQWDRPAKKAAANGKRVRGRRGNGMDEEWF